MKNYIKITIVISIIFIFSVKCNSQVDFQQDSPYPPSPVISGIIWDSSSLVRRTPGSDNWVVTWAADDNQYTSWGDGGGFGGTNSDGRVSLGVARIVGMPKSFAGQNVWGGKNPENPATFGGKSYGMLSIEGVLYMWVGPGSNVESLTETRLAVSKDLGATWQLSNIFFRQADGFSLPTFLNFGKDYDGSRDAFVYIYSYDWSSTPVININLARVPKNEITNRAAFEFFNGLDGNGNPLWTSDITQRESVYTDSNGGVNTPSAIYNSVLNRYLLLIPHGTTSSPTGGLGIFDAPEPWGPWTTVEYTDNWMGSTNMFFANIPNKWISPDGKTFYLVFTGYGSDIIAKDAYQHMKGVFTIANTTSDTTVPTTPQGPNDIVQSESQVDLAWETASDPE